jgi:hypothetical protein
VAEEGYDRCFSPAVKRWHAGCIVLGLLKPMGTESFDSKSAVVTGPTQWVVASGLTKTIVVKAADGTEHTFHFVARTAVHGAEKAGVVTKESFHGLKEGSEVIVHYTAKGREETAEEVDHIGEGGLKATEGTVTHLGRATKTLTVKTADGTAEAFGLTDHAAEDAGRDISEGAEKSGKVTVYYTEHAGHKVAHFFTKVL